MSKKLSDNCYKKKKVLLFLSLRFQRSLGLALDGAWWGVTDLCWVIYESSRMAEKRRRRKRATEDFFKERDSMFFLLFLLPYGWAQESDAGIGMREKGADVTVI
jgi:hypothetical protein